MFGSNAPRWTKLKPLGVDWLHHARRGCNEFFYTEQQIINNINNTRMFKTLNPVWSDTILVEHQFEQSATLKFTVYVVGIYRLNTFQCQHLHYLNIKVRMCEVYSKIRQLAACSFLLCLVLNVFRIDIDRKHENKDTSRTQLEREYVKVLAELDQDLKQIEAFQNGAREHPPEQRELWQLLGFCEVNRSEILAAKKRSEPLHLNLK